MSVEIHLPQWLAPPEKMDSFENYGPQMPEISQGLFRAISEGVFGFKIKRIREEPVPNE